MEIVNSESRIIPAMDDERPDWLPEGWKVDVRQVDIERKRKFYIDPKSGHKFYTKPEVLRYLNGEVAPQKRKEQCKTRIKRTAAENLPPGWIKETRKIKGGNTRGYPYYIDPVTGHRFRSFKAAVRYLEAKGEVKVSELNDGVTVTRTVAKKLPPGWIKEISTRKKGEKIKKEALYIDPVTGLYFRSMIEVCRYLGIKDPRKVASDDEYYSSSESEDDSQIVDVKRIAAKHLPPGWIRETVTRKRDDDKITKLRRFIEPDTGNYFRSMPKIYRYLGIEDPRKKALSKADDEDCSSAESEDHSQSSSTEAEGQLLIEYKKDKKSTKRKTRKSGTKVDMHMPGVDSRVNKRKKGTSDLPSRTSKRVAALAQIDPPNEVDTRNESEENSTEDSTKQKEPVPLLIEHPSCTEENKDVVKEDEMSEKQPSADMMKEHEESEKQPDIPFEDQLVDVKIIEGEIPPSGCVGPDSCLEIEGKTLAGETLDSVELVLSQQCLDDPNARKGL